MTTERRLLLAILIACALVVFAGCATLTPAQARGADDTRIFLEAIARVYGLPQPAVVIGTHRPGVAASYDHGTFTVWTRAVDQSWRDALLAHEAAHWILGHDAPLRGLDDADRHAEQYQREVAAHVKAVEILVQVKGMTARRAVRAMHDYLMSVKAAQDRTTGYTAPMGHTGACQEASDMLLGLPQHRDWTWSLACSPWSSGGHAGK